MTAMLLPIESLVDLLTDGSALQVVVVITLLAAVNLALLYWFGRYTWRYLSGCRNLPHPDPLAIHQIRDPVPAEDMADLVSAAILLVNSDDRILRFNRAALNMFGYAADELTDLTYQRLLVLPGEGLESVGGLRRTASGAALLEHAGFGLRKDGSRFAAEVSVRLVRSHPIEALIEIRDSRSIRNSDHPDPAGGNRELVEITRRMAQLARQVRLRDALPGDQADFVRALRDYAGRAEALICPESDVLQLIHLGRWLEDAVKSFREERAEVVANITLPPLEEVNFHCMLKTQPLARLVTVLLAYAEDALFSPEVAVHLTHHRSSGPADPAAPAAGIDRRLSLLFIVGAGPQQGAMDALTTQADPVPADPRLRLAFELAEEIEGKLSVDANDKTGWLFQLSFSSRCFGMSSQVLLGSPDVESALSRSATPPTSLQSSEVSGQLHLSRARASGIRILLVSYTADLREWARDLLLSEGYQLIHVEPNGLLRHLHEDSAYQLIILESGHEIEEDFDPTFEIRQLLGIDAAAILLVDNYSSNPDRTYFDQQLRLRFPMRNSAFITAIRKLVRSTELLA